MSQLDEIMHDVVNKKDPFDELIELINETNLKEIDLVIIDGIIDLLEMREKSLHSLRQKIHLIKNDKYIEQMLRKKDLLMI